MFQTELTRRIAVNEDGKRKKITKQEAVAKQAINQAAAGDLKAIPIVLNETRLHATDPGAGLAQSATTSQEDEMTMASIVKRIVEINMPMAPTNAPETCVELQGNKSDQESSK